VLTRLPSLLFKVEVQANDHVVTLSDHLNVRHCASETETAFAAKVQVTHSAQTHTLVKCNQNDACDHPAPKFVPVTPAGADVKYTSDQMRDLEEFVTGPSDYRLHAEDRQEANEESRQAAEDGVHVGEEQVVDVWRRLVVVCFHNGPADRMKHGLDKDDAATPAVQEVEVLVRDASQDRENVLAGREENGEWSQRVREDSHTVGKPTQGGTSFPWLLRRFCVHPNVTGESVHMLAIDRNINRLKRCLREDE
jgi:hypothetical protein